MTAELDISGPGTSALVARGRPMKNKSTSELNPLMYPVGVAYRLAVLAEICDEGGY